MQYGNFTVRENNVEERWKGNSVQRSESRGLSNSSLLINCQKAPINNKRYNDTLGLVAILLYKINLSGLPCLI